MSSFHGNDLTEIIGKIEEYLSNKKTFNPDYSLSSILITWSKEDYCWKAVIVN